MNIYEETTEEKFYYDSYTGTYWVHDEEWSEPREFTENELENELGHELFHELSHE